VLALLGWVVLCWWGSELEVVCRGVGSVRVGSTRVASCRVRKKGRASVGPGGGGP
jgi:hypothetical protein